MGAIFRPQYRDRHGAMQESAVWWVRFRQHGKTVRQSTETTSEQKARAFLREREGKVALNIPVNVKADRLTLGEAADLIRNDYAANGRKSARTLEYPLAHLLAHFGETARWPGSRRAPSRRTRRRGSPPRCSPRLSIGS